MLNIGWGGDALMLVGFLVLFAFYKWGEAKGWWEGGKARKAHKAEKRQAARRVQRHSRP